MPVDRKDVNGTSYAAETSDRLIALLERLRAARTRVVFVYGDPKTGIAWGPDATPDRGRIGRSTGSEKIPLLIRTSRSLGGEGLLDHCIVEIRESKGARVIYRITPDFEYVQGFGQLQFTKPLNVDKVTP